MSGWKQGLSLTWRSLGRRKSRPTSILLAVAWGTLSMVFLLAFAEGMKRQMTLGQDGLSSGAVILWPGSTTKAWEGMRAGRAIRLEAADVDLLRLKVPELEHVAGERQSWAVDLRAGDRSASARVTGVPPCFEVIRAHHPQPGGRFLNDKDEEQRRRSIFLGHELKEELFGAEEAVGRTVLVRGVPFTVVGILVEKIQMGMYSGPDSQKASIPLSTFEALFGPGRYNTLLYTVKPPHSTAGLETRVREVLAGRQHFDPADKSALHFWDTAAHRETFNKVTGGMQLFMGITGAMTLLVAGVGLANMLFVSVRRRTREIGLQMAIGARKSAVMSQILGESLLMAGIGGYLGIGAAWILIEAFLQIPVQSQVFEFIGKPVLSLPLGVLTVLVLVGIACLAGLFPARRAAGMNPVEALRHE